MDDLDLTMSAEEFWKYSNNLKVNKYYESYVICLSIKFAPSVIFCSVSFVTGEFQKCLDESTFLLNFRSFPREFVR